MALPDAEGVVFESLQEVGEPAREGGVDSEFDYGHFDGLVGGMVLLGGFWLGACFYCW